MSAYDGKEAEASALQHYHGVPNLPHTPAEKGFWRRFLETAMPWFAHKWDLADRAADARLAKEVADAELTSAQALLTRAQAAQEAMKAISMAQAMEEQKLAVLPVIPATPEEIEAAAEAILNKIAELSWKKGTQIRVRSMEEEGAVSSSAASDVAEEAADEE